MVVWGWRKEGEVGVRRRFEKKKWGREVVCVCVCVCLNAFIGTSYIYVGRNVIS